MMPLLSAASVSALQMVGAVSFDPEIRGIMIVLTSVVILIGSLALILSTNTGARLGTLISLAGLFGWMALMGLTWTLYGIGYAGNAPGWIIDEIVVGDLGASENEALSEMPNRTDAYYVVRDEVLAGNPEFDGLEGSQAPRSLSDLAGVDAELVDSALDGNGVDLADWTIVAGADPARGEAAAAAEAALVEAELAELDGRTYVALGNFKFGGKPDRDSPAIVDGIKNKWDHAWSHITNFGNPVLYSVVQFQASTAPPPVPGEAPPVPLLDETADPVTIVMTRDYGDVRLPPFLITIGSTAIFLMLCLMLHTREKLALANAADAAEAA